MRNISKILLLIISLICLLSCYEYKSKAIIADYVVGAKYEIIKVDGGPAERIQHGLIVTKVPFVIVEQGSHKLTLREHKINGVNQESNTFEIKEVKGDAVRLLG